MLEWIIQPDPVWQEILIGGAIGITLGLIIVVAILVAMSFAAQKKWLQ